jgi:hypothetical protein
MLLLDERGYGANLTLIEEAYNMAENPIQRYDAVRVKIWPREVNELNEYESMFYISTNQEMIERNERARIRDGDGVSYRMAGRWGEDMEFEISEDEPFYLPETMIDLILERAEQELGITFSISTKSCLKTELMNQYIEIAEPWHQANADAQEDEQDDRWQQEERWELEDRWENRD